MAATVTVLEPETAEHAAAMLADAASERMLVVPHGNRTKLGPVSPQAATLSTIRLTKGLAHYAGDLVATAPAGSTLRDVNLALARERQWIPIDPPFADRATIGGIVATNDSGPRRQRFGGPRDLVIGIEVALASGRVAHSGGRVVKNVAGYDLGRLFCGSHGSLGVITSVTFKLAPMAPASRTVVARFPRPAQAAALALELAVDASITPSTLEITAPDARLLVRFDSTERSAERMSSAAATHLAKSTTDVAIVSGDAEASVWARHQELESSNDALIASVSILPTLAASALDDVQRLAADCGVDWSATGRAALGVLRIAIAGSADATSRFAAGLRTALAARGGHVRFSGNRLLLADAVDASGPVGTSAAVAFAVKQRFDPTGVLPYPWSRA